MINQRAWASAALIFLAGCGGGSEESSSTTAPAATAPAAAVSQLRTALSARATAAAAASPAQAAEQLLDHAEASFPALFPSHQTTATLDPFVFRYYPQTGIYVGVVVKGGMGYALDGVYVMGGPFGATAVHVGQLSDFITPTEPGPGGPAGPNNGCFDLSLFETAGTRVELTLQYSGDGEGVMAQEWVVNGTKAFEGHDAIETQVRMSFTAKGATAAAETETRSYDKRTGDAEVTSYGSEFRSSNPTPGGLLTSHGRDVTNPPSVDRTAGLAVGQSITQSTTTISTSTIDIPGLPNTPSPTTSTTTETIKFVGREQVKVPANTYSTCRFESTSADEPNTVTTIWVIEGKGLMVKGQTTVNGTVQSTQQATAVKLNGQPL